MELVLITATSLLAYFVVLSRKTFMQFRKNNIKSNFFVSAILTIFIFTVHVQIAWEKKSDFKFVKFVFKQFFLRFDIGLIVLVELVKEDFIVNRVSEEKETRGLFSWIKNFSMRNQYTDMIEACLA
ncbi:hypothetical protein ACQUE8_11585 [Enterococcus casseliflavus]|uniref:hypothetical protein n=1 Tax=Enterococcus casseliflavus TaxID=37734 RepID=UPI003D0EFC40